MPSSAMNIESTIPSPATAGVVDVARRIASAAEFIEHHYLGGLMMQTMPLHPFMSYLHHRLLNYEWLLLKNKRAFLPDEDPLPPPKEAIKILRWLREFFHHRASWEREILKQVNDRALGDDVGFVGALTERLLEGKETMTQRELDAVLEVNKRQAVALRAAHDALKEPLRRPWELTEMVLREFEEAYGDVEVEVNGICTPVDDGISERMTPDAEQPSGQEPSPQGARIHAHPPYHNSGRTWFAHPVTFADLIGSPHQWNHPPPASYTLISGTSKTNNSSDEAASHFIDATALGISGLAILKLEHPLNDDAVKNLDWDVLRFLRLALWDYTNGHPERKGKRESLEVVKGEVRRRTVAAVEGPVTDEVHDEDGARCGQTVTRNSVNGVAVAPAPSEKTPESPPATSFRGEDAGAQLNGATPRPSPSANSSRTASNAPLDHLFEPAHPLPHPQLYANASINETRPFLRSQPYEDPNNHINDQPETTQGPTYLMSMSGAYNPITPLFLELKQQEEPAPVDPRAPTIPSPPLLPLTPNNAPSNTPCCFTRMKQKLRSSRRQSPTTANSTRAPTSPPPLIPPSSPSTPSTLSSSDPWLAPLNTAYRYKPSPPPKKKLRSSRGRGRIEETSAASMEETRSLGTERGLDFDFDFDVDERAPVEIIDGLRVGEI